MVHGCLGLSFGPSWDTLWANAYKLGLSTCGSFDDSVHGCHESIGIEEDLLLQLVVQSLFAHTGNLGIFCLLRKVARASQFFIKQA